MAKFYITTPLYYVNDKPHLGHAYTQIAADVLARWNRMTGNRTHFLTGTDEHGQKVYLSAQKRNKTPKEHVDDMAPAFKKLWKRLLITEDDYIRTTDKRHIDVVQAVLQQLLDQGDIYSDNYEGWYSTSEERFWTEKDLVDGKCPLSGLPVEWIKEKNYFFRMSKYADKLREWIADNPDFIQPETRKNEVLGYLKKDVGDLCISRPKSRLPWGIALPFDEEYVTYVWFDALLNYISALGYHPDPDKRSAQFDELWPADVQLLGKDILTTHSVYWGTMLFALGLQPAKKLFAHGWWTVEGRKMGKSLGNALDPNFLEENYGVDACRFYMLREFPFGGDGNFSHDSFMVRYNSDLANDFGNLAHRALSMTQKWLGGVIPELDEPAEEDLLLDALCAKTLADFTDQLNSLMFTQAFDTLWTLIRSGNKYIDSQEPWKLNREGNLKRLGGVMRRSMEICRVAARLLSPVTPVKSAELLEKLGVTEQGPLDRLDGLKAGHRVEAGDPLFPRMKELPEGIRKMKEQIFGEAPKKETQVVKTEKRIKLKVFQRVPFQTGLIKNISHEGENSKIEVDVGGEESLAITAPKLTDSKIGDGVIVAGPSDKNNFDKIVLKTGKIVSAEPHPEADKLLMMKVDIGEDEKRSIVAGIANRFSPDELIDHKVTLVANLKPSKLRGVLSQGMILAAGGEVLQALAVSPDGAKIGSRLEWIGDEQHGLMALKKSDGSFELMTLSASCTAGAVVR